MKTRNQLKAILAYAVAYPRSTVWSVHPSHQAAYHALGQAQDVLTEVGYHIDLSPRVIISQRTILLGNGSRIMFMNTSEENSLRGFADVDVMELDGVPYGADLRAARAADGMVLL